jgi:peptidoglycan/LPS O-acetylase OafA/YrhL
LRFLAAISVAVAHGATLCLKTQSPNQAIQHWLSVGAGFGMTLFFVLSGFVIHYNYRALIGTQGIAGTATISVGEVRPAVSALPADTAYRSVGCSPT